jgi:hypothetical protein
MDRKEFLDRYYLAKGQIDNLLNEMSELEAEYVKSNSPIKADADNPVLCEVEITTEYISFKDGVKEIRTVKEDKWLVGYKLVRPFDPGVRLVWKHHDREKAPCFVYPVFRKVKKDGSVGAKIDREFFRFVDSKNIVFWEKGNPENRYMCDFEGDIVKVGGHDKDQKDGERE